MVEITIRVVGMSNLPKKDVERSHRYFTSILPGMGSSLSESEDAMAWWTAFIANTVCAMAASVGQELATQLVKDLADAVTEEPMKSMLARYDRPPDVH